MISEEIFLLACMLTLTSAGITICIYQWWESLIRERRGEVKHSTPARFDMPSVREDIAHATEVFNAVGYVRKDILIKRSITGFNYAVITFVKGQRDEETADSL